MEILIFEYIKLTNYRPYYGEQTLYFREKNKEDESIYKKNIVLIGGLNGHGKTSLINSVNVALFGHRFFENQNEYKKFMNKSINDRHIREGGKEGSIELAFTDDTGSFAIQVTFVAGHSEEIRKVFELNQDLEKIREVQLSTEEYYDFIDSRIPLDVAQFFIFDAEKIRDLVGEQEKDETIRAIQKVVSLELYKQLQKDIEKIHYDLTKSIKDKVSSDELDELFDKLEEITKKIEEAEKNYDNIDAEMKKISAKEQGKQQERRRILAQNSRAKQKISKRIGEYEEKLKNIERDLSNSMSNHLNMLILQPLIKNLKERIKKERNIQNAILRANAEFAPFEDFINKLLSLDFSPPLTTDQKNQLINKGKKVWADINNLTNNLINKQNELLHDLSQSEYNKLISYQEIQSTDLKQLMDEKQQLESLLIKNKAELESAPDEIDTSELDKEINKLNQKLGELRRQKREYFTAINQSKSDKMKINNEIRNKQEKLAEIGPLKEKLDLTERLNAATSEFIKQVTHLKAKQLKNEVEIIIKQLFRKDDFHKVNFHPEEFTLSFYNEYGEKVDLMSRSEGEKQLIALAMIWALTKVSGSKFPFVIDTPLARLDSIHRLNIVNHYFTKLSDQVVILSTDTEITKDFYQELSPFINKEYILQFDEETKTTTISEGYFFEQEMTSWLV